METTGISVMVSIGLLLYFEQGCQEQVYDSRFQEWYTEMWCEWTRQEEVFVISLLEGGWWGEYDKDKEEKIWNNRVIREVAVMQRSSRR